MSLWYRSLIASLLLTELFEGVFALLCGKRGPSLGLVALANVLTNPAVVLVSLLWMRAGLPARRLLTAAAELLAFLTEGFVYARKAPDAFPAPYRFSLAANGLSFFLGLGLRTVLHGGLL